MTTVKRKLIASEAFIAWLHDSGLGFPKNARQVVIDAHRERPLRIQIDCFGATTTLEEVGESRGVMTTLVEVSEQGGTNEPENIDNV